MRSSTTSAGASESLPDLASAILENNAGSGGTSSESLEQPPRTAVVDFGDSDIDIRVGNVLFKTHRFVLRKFAKIEGLAQPAVLISMPGRNDDGAEDFYNTFKILYASVIEGPFKFETPVLLSALRVSAKYDYPQLKGFCISQLKGVPLLPIERLQIARECDIASWEEQAYAELAIRKTAISKEEAQIIGMDAFVRIAERRETGSNQGVDVGRSSSGSEASPRSYNPVSAVSSWFSTRSSSTPLLPTHDEMI